MTPSHPYTLTDKELAEQAQEVALRISHSSLPVSDVVIVQQLAARLVSRDKEQMEKTNAI